MGVDILYYSEYIAFAADWNRNGVYDANELVDLGYQTTYYADYSIQVPVDAVPGNTSFRVACSYGNIAGQVCSDFASWQYGGEAEEYGLTISAPPSNPPVADFSANNTNPGMSEVVTFTDLSTEAPSSHSWSFSPSTVTFFNSTTSSSANPQVRFNAPGTYTVTLNATNNSGSDDEIKVDYITVADGYHIPNDGSIVSAVATCSGNVYDFGGASSSGSGGSGGVNIYPTDASTPINISGSIDLPASGNVTFVVYDGAYNGTLLYSSTVDNGAVDITATNVDGYLNITVLDNSGGADSWDIDLAITCATPCSGTPNTPSATISAITDLCEASQVLLAVTGYTSGNGVSYDWEYSTDGSSGWTSLASPNASIYPTSASHQALGNFWRYKTTCSFSGLSSYSNVAERIEPTITSGGNASECGSFTGNLSASTNVGNVEWYAASSGGTALSTGATYAPGNTSTTTYYAASSGCPGTRTAITATVNANPTSPSATVDGASSADICPGGTVALVGSATGSSITTNSTSTNSTAGAIIDNTDLIRTIAISGTNADANELISLELNLTHTFTGDLDITLQAPNGSTIILSDDNGGTGENYTNTVFSTSGGSIISGSAPFTGTYTPEQAFSNLTGSADGTWTLNIYDDAGGDTGNFANFSITIPATSTSTVTYSWSLDGGTTTMTTGASATSDALNSNSTITMTATDDGNSCTSTATASVTVNGLPSNSSVAISSPSSPPKNSENLSAIISTTDPESATVYSENDWRVDGTSFAVQNLSFDADGSDGLTSNSSQGGALTAYGDATQVSGIKGQAYEFDGVNDYLQNASVNIDPSNGLSISLWQYTITTASSSGNDAYHQWVNLGPGQQMVLRNSFTNGIEAYVSTGGNLTGWCSGCGTGDFIYLTNQVSAGSWNHWVVTWNPDRTFKLYKNGTLIKTNVAAEGALSTITSLSISGNSAENFNGKIDELLIFERDISADQVTALYNSGTPSYSTIADDETSCGESWTMSSSPVDAAGCQGSATLSSGVTISGAQVATADVTDYSTTCGVQTYDIAIDDLTASGSWEVSPAKCRFI